MVIYIKPENSFFFFWEGFETHAISPPNTTIYYLYAMMYHHLFIFIFCRSYFRHKVFVSFVVFSGKKNILFIMVYILPLVFTFNVYPAKWKETVGATTKSIIIPANKKSSNHVGGIRLCQKTIILPFRLIHNILRTIITIRRLYNIVI